MKGWFTRATLAVALVNYYQYTMHKGSEDTMKKKILLIGGGAILLVGAILFGAFFAGPLFASAQSTQGQATTNTASTTTTNPYCEQYLQDLAGRLNVSVSTLQQDKLAAREDVIAQMVKDGKLTQSQANAIISKLESHQACTGTGAAWEIRIIISSLRQYVPQIESQIAQGLHLSTTQLQSDLNNGMTLKQVARQQNVSSSQLKTIVQDAIQNEVNQAVHDGNLTQAQATNFTQFLQKHPGVISRIINRKWAA
jgi:polyhydroxyalkanoate synthesis regulator phasin